MAWLTQYYLVIGKNWKQKKTSKCGICVELLFPIIVALILMGFMESLLPSKNDRLIGEIPPVTHWMAEDDYYMLLYTPNDTTTNEFMDKFSFLHTSTLLSDSSLIKGFSSPDDMQKYFEDNYEDVEFGLEDNTGKLEYSIRIDFQKVADTDEVYDVDDGLALNKRYNESGFTALQLGIDRTLLSVYSNISTIFEPTVAQFDFASPPLWKRMLTLSGTYEVVGPIFILIALYVSIFRFLTAVVYEKEAKIKEEMKMMGLRPGVDNSAWFHTIMVFATIPLFILGAILKSRFYHHSNMGTIYFVLFSQLFSLYSLSILVSKFVNKAKFAGVIGFLVTIVMAFIGIAVVATDTENEHLKLFLSLFSPAALVFANQGLILSEKDGAGTNSGNLNHKWRDGTPSVGSTLALMYFDIFLYALLSWYIDNILPGDFGLARPPLFFFTPKYWKEMFGTDNTKYEELPPSYTEISEDVEPVNAELQKRASVVICDLKKVFTKGVRQKQFTAVDGLDLTMYDDQITAFLGHNGAGKTTTISMLTGLIPVSAGDAYVRGYSIKSQMKNVRKTLGICPQQDVIWPELSVYDHLYLYAGLKGVPLKRIKSAVDELIEEIGLNEKRLFPSGALSGGQKRKLCLAMAFIGGSDVIFLDEPTSGMDPVTRRDVWDFLNNNKKGRTIVLTTHFMDEADFLGDRIAIISHGQLRCAGSSLFLKSRLGVGYTLTMTKNKSCNSERVDNFILSSIPGASVLAAFGGELSYRLPKHASPKFAELFSKLDDNKHIFGIDNYGVSVTTLEEVFLRIGIEDKEERDESTEVTMLGRDKEKVDVALAHKTRGHRFFQQLYAQLVKRVIVYRRDIINLGFTFLLPLLVVLASVAIIRKSNNIVIGTTPPPPLVINTTLYQQRPFFYVGNSTEWLTTSPFYDSLSFVNYSSASDFDEYIQNQYHGVPAAGGFMLQDMGYNYNFLHSTTKYRIDFNETLLHIVPSEINLISDALMRRFTNGAYSIQLTSKPFPHIIQNFELTLSALNFNLLYYPLLILIAFAFLAAGSVASIVQERMLNVKRLLSVSGASKSSYWISNFIFDYLIFFVLVVVAFVVSATAGHKTFIDGALGPLFVVMVLFSLSLLAQCYCLSLLFNSYTAVTGALFVMNVALGFVLEMGYAVMTIFAAGEPEDWETLIKILFMVFNAISPQFGFICAIQRLGGFMSPFTKTGSWFSLYLMGFPTLMFIGHFIFWMSLLLLVEYREQIFGCFSCKPKRMGEKINNEPNEDQDVTNERTRLRDDPKSKSDLVRVIGLRKEYPAPHGIKVAVKNLTLGISSGECFGLLGMNGAGKSTTLGALSGDIAPTQGNIWLNGYNLRTNPEDALKYFGWCPQFDALIGSLTAREQLTMYARIKGLENSVIDDTVNSFIHMLDLTQYADRAVAGYSGGNKRKLSLAVAMIGNPPIVFLDEPSTGMDPLARRYMWNVISALGANKSVVVTTHSMEECDALASRIGIMSNGEMVCLGTSQHLKSRFASGYSLQLKIKYQYLKQTKDAILQQFPYARVVDEHGDMVTYEVPQTAQLKLSTIFSILQELSLFLDDFSVSQTSLEQVFLKLAQKKDKEGENGNTRQDAAEFV